MKKEFEYVGKAMGTDYSIAVICSSKELADKMHQMSKKYIETYEAKFSRFLPTSELTTLNREKDLIVSQTFLDVTIKARQVFTETGGVFNPLVQISRFGYEKDFKDIENNKSKSNLKIIENYDIDFSSTIIDKEKSRICLSEGQKLDYGGFLKGYLSEIIAKKIRSYSEEISGVIVNLGGDIYTEGLDSSNEKFVFYIFNPVSNNENEKVVLFNHGLATSGTYKRHWNYFGEKFHHILDHSGHKNPESDIVSASIVHSSGCKAEAYAKVFLSIGYENALKLLNQKDFSFVLIKSDGSVIKKTNESIS